MKKIPIVEIFPTIQGEGPGLGKPSLFIRVGGCDLRCRFKGVACDTPYAVHTPKYLDKNMPELKYGYDNWEPMDAEEIVRVIKASGMFNVVLTGGHPLLYQDVVSEIIKMCSEQLLQVSFEIETQGTIPITLQLANNMNVIFNVSVKLKSSNQEEGYDDKRINIEALRSFNSRNSFYKFVITDLVNDVNEIKQIYNQHPLLIYIMPEGITRDEVLKNSIDVVKLAIREDWIFTPREHINIWDSKKGV